MTRPPAHGAVGVSAPAGGTVPAHGLNGTTGSARMGQPAAGLLPTRERRPGYIALLVALIVGLAAVGGVLYSKAGAKTQVIVVVHEVAAGHPVQRADLGTVAVAGAVTAIAASGLTSVVGQTAAVPLLPHMLLLRSMLSTAGPLSTGQALVGVAVSPGQLPADGLAAGDVVQVVQLPPQVAAATAGTVPVATVLVTDARVFSTHADPSNAGSTDVSLVVSVAQSTKIAAASAARLIALVQVPAS
jgi:hypothetical protein